VFDQLGGVTVPAVLMRLNFYGYLMLMQSAHFKFLNSLFYGLLPTDPTILANLFKLLTSKFSTFASTSIFCYKMLFSYFKENLTMLPIAI
jgi:hypothetical protein